jgi:hypothetical protein
MSTQEGPLTKLLRATGHTEPLAPIPTVARITEMPLAVGVPVSRSTPAAAICSCRIFEKAAGSELCPACTRKQAKRIVDDARHRQHVEAVHRETTERRLTEHDPHWRERFTDYKVAERFYRDELPKLGDGVDCGREEPRDTLR